MVCLNPAVQQLHSVRYYSTLAATPAWQMPVQAAQAHRSAAIFRLQEEVPLCIVFVHGNTS
jgi:hypothetical protein